MMTKPNEVKQRRACQHCYQKKVRCDYDLREGACSRCMQDGVVCLLPDEAEKPSRHSIREDVQVLTTRVRVLEETLLQSQRQSKNPTPEGIATQPSVLEGNGGPVSDPVRRLTVRNFRGPNSPWGVLLESARSNGANPELLEAAQLVDEDRTSEAPILDRPTSLLSDIPSEDIFRYLESYHQNAPFPIVHYDTLVQVAERVFSTGVAERAGEICCILLYMAFGVAQSNDIESSTKAQSQSGRFFNQAFNLLPQLLLESDLWALKALTLMVHYLQATSTPQSCWTLLGSASRMAITLGFHRKDGSINTFSAIETEEGTRAWWLCYIMDKTFSAAFDYPPSMMENYLDDQASTFPAPFLQLAEAESFDSAANDASDAEFFREMIELSRDRNSTDRLKSLSSEASSDYSQLRRYERPQAPGSLPSSGLQRDIGELAYNNAILTASAQQAGLIPPHTECIRCARRTLEIITDTETAGHTMCLWMWMYYGFAAAVVLFVHSSLEPSHPEALGDMALLSELQKLCLSLAEKGSDGCKRLTRILELMENAAMSAMKSSARRMVTTKRKRELDAEREEPGSKSQRVHDDDETFALFDSNDRDDDLWGNIPETFAWDDWGTWLEEWPLDSTANQ